MMTRDTTGQHDNRIDKYTNHVNEYTTEITPKGHGENNGAGVYG